MRHHRALRNAGYFVAGAASAAVLLGGAAYAITDTVFKYKTDQTGHLQIPAAAFSSADSSVVTTNTGLGIAPAGHARACFVAPVTLPHGSTMSQLTYWYTENDEIQLDFLRTTMSDLSVETIFPEEKPPASAQSRARSVKIPEAFQKINTAAYSYYLSVCVFDSSDSFWGARVTYTYNNAGD